MQLSVSNLGWPSQETEWCIEKLLQNGITGVEIAPLKVFNSWEEASSHDAINKVKTYFREHKLTVSSFQAITFGAHDLALLGNEKEKSNFLQHLEKVASLLSSLEGECAVFGSPGLRKDSNYNEKELAQVLTSIDSIFTKHKVYFALETVPSYYGCNLLNTLDQTETLLSKLQLTRVVRHFDTGCQFLAGDFEQKTLCDNFIGKSKHLHISEVDLNNFASPSSYNLRIASQIKEQYKGKWCVLEMSDKTFTRETFISSIENFVTLFR
ncbi:TIM barrel protein [uncultured Alteromonas sp.]|jgi:sugar phosphate isomerase/epimerase|uniref:sugar phosphate isomerase/epimerase family protein n=1 Tax=uncultured Alteromonas sp. TaxID=179113 RepID=UPI0030EE32DA|tara:strand:- start:3172 stop:3972 length:801 start_codon:yes stop_codon:yes gene_type:complete